MIRKLRWKFIAVIMAIVCLFLAGILSSLYYTAERGYERRSQMVLHESLDRAYPFRGPAFFNDGQPVIVVSVNSLGKMTIYENQIHYIADDTLPALIEAIEATGEDEGMVGEGSLRFFLKRYRNGETRYSLVDNYVMRTSLQSQAMTSWAIGLGAAALFFIVSFLLSRWIVGPVEAAWNRQRQFVADASHELKTPLTVVLSNADMLSASGAIADERNHSRLEHIKAESQHMRGLIEDLLTLARSDSGAEKAPQEIVSLSYILSHSVLTLEPAIFDQKRTLETWITDGQMVMGDAGKLRQLVDILMDNACKYSEENSTIEVRLELIGKREVLLSVKSRGKPIPTEDLSNIFQRFYRSDKSRGEEKGYGLGLAIAESIVKEHNGRIWAQTDGVSSNTFFVRMNTVGRHEK